MLWFGHGRRIAALEKKMAKREQEIACAGGGHVYELITLTKGPEIRCKHCWHFPNDKKKNP